MELEFSRESEEEWLLIILIIKNSATFWSVHKVEIVLRDGRGIIPDDLEVIEGVFYVEIQVVKGWMA